MDIQAVIPYAIAALGDPATKVRRAAAELLVEIDQLYPANVESKKSAKQFRQWASDDLYGPGKETQGTKWLSPDIVVRLLRDILIPALEECVLDKKHVESLFQKSLDSPRTSDSPKKHEVGRLPQATRASIFSFLASHAVHTPMLLVKLRLLAPLNQIRSIASTTRTKLLLPVFNNGRLSVHQKHLSTAKMSISKLREFDDQAVTTVTANDKDGLQFFTAIINGDVATDRPNLIGLYSKGCDLCGRL